MELLIDKHHISIFYDPRHFVVARWKGYFTNESFKDGCLLIMKYIAEKKCSLGLNDGRLAKGTFLQALGWVDDSFLPQLIQAGIKKIAYVVSSEFASLRSIERVLELTDEYQAQLFDDYDAAVNWLLGDKGISNSKEVPSQDKLIIREKDKFVLLDYADIQYLYSFEKGTALHCSGETHYTKLSLKEVHTQLPDQFARIHRSYIVNTQHVSAIKHHKSGSYHLFLKDLPRIRIPVSRKHVPTLKKLLKL